MRALDASGMCVFMSLRVFLEDGESFVCKLCGALKKPFWMSVSRPAQMNDCETRQVHGRVRGSRRVGLR